MNEIDHIASHDQFAKDYDNQVKEYHSHAHDVLFGLCYEYIRTPGRLVDLGIGTGLSSVHFAHAGLEVIGLDGSQGMLDECRKKAFAKELMQYDIRQVPYPFSDTSFSYVICCGVFHFFADVQPIINDAFRLLNDSGICAFTIASPQQNDLPENSADIPDYVKAPTAWGIPIYKHSDTYINRIADSLGFSILKEQKILADSGDESQPDLLFKAIVIRK